MNRIGEERYNNNNSLMKITDYRNSKDIDVYFPDYNWTYYHARYDNFTRGKIKCPYEPRYYNVGYLGEGEYIIKENGECTKCYRTWYHMLQRCYDIDHLYKNPTYENCFVCEEWLNFQNFADWFYDNYYEVNDELMCLDKDILYKGNLIYSPETCVFVTQKINSLFVKSDTIRGELPIGVQIDKRRNTYGAYCNNGYGERTYLGSFDTPEKAFYMYKNYKEELIKNIAEEYKSYIPIELYNALNNYKVEIND